DGIRDKLVTGVQTCALPISEIDVREAGPSLVAGPEQRLGVSALAVAKAEGRRDRACDDALQVALVHLARGMPAGADPVREHVGRSEERRVGKEGGAWGEAGV